MKAVASVFTIDVEDWFHVLDLSDGPSVESWDTLPSRVERNFLELLDLIEEHGVSSTCFFLGWVAKRFPQLVRQAAARGHEIASHGFQHELVYKLTPYQFRQDAIRARKTIEDVVGSSVCGFRAPGFSVTADTPWFFDELADAGYRYDSSVFPARRGHGGLPGATLGPCSYPTRSGRDIFEFPISLTGISGVRTCLVGGGYMRLAPWPLIRFGANKVLAENRPVVFYVHPREIDVDCPRLRMSRVRAFKSYVNLHSTPAKIASICREFSPTSFEAAFAGDAEFSTIWNQKTVVARRAGATSTI